MCTGRRKSKWGAVTQFLLGRFIYNNTVCKNQDFILNNFKYGWIY